MDHQGQVEPASRLDMDHEAVALPLHVCHGSPGEPVVIKTGLADGDHTRQLPTLQQILHRGFEHPFIVRMHPDGGPEIVVVACQPVHLCKFFQCRADT